MMRLSKKTIVELINNEISLLINFECKAFSVDDIKEIEESNNILINDSDIWVGEPVLTREDIQRFLNSIDSWLADKIVNVYGSDWFFSSYLHKICKTSGINVIYILALIQKEQSVLYKKTPPSPRVQSRILGYGMTESGDIPKYYGFTTQFNGAVWQLRHYKRDEKRKIERLDSMKLYDKDIKGYTPLTMAEKASLFYTPRYSALVLQSSLIESIELKLKRLDMI